ncbi:MAG: hypothetical protein R3C14_28120 [Caldilineaceae bacterium]
MNHVPLFVAIVLVSSIVLLLITWWHEQRINHHRAFWRAFEANTLLLIGLTILAFAVIIVSIIFAIWF